MASIPEENGSLFAPAQSLPAERKKPRPLKSTLATCSRTWSQQTQ
ncbi:MAG: hypothetical protein ACTSWW_06715 [Promethearchaeota archaeon]